MTTKRRNQQKRRTRKQDKHASYVIIQQPKSPVSAQPASESSAPSISPFPPRLNTRQAAEFLGLKEQTLVLWRHTKSVNVPYLKIGGAVRYNLEDLQKFVEQHRVTA